VALLKPQIACPLPPAKWFHAKIWHELAIYLQLSTNQPPNLPIALDDRVAPGLSDVMEILHDVNMLYSP
jgi:hypothetical protein